MGKTYKFTLPQNKEVENTNVRVENGEVLVEVELKEKFQPKDGDFCVSKYGCVFIYCDRGQPSKNVYGCYCGEYCDGLRIQPFYSDKWTIKEGCRLATPEEKADFLKRLEGEKHLRWNAEKKCLEDIRWEPNNRDYYFFVDSDGRIRRTRNVARWDAMRVNINNCFPTEEAAQPYADKIKEIFKNSKAE